MGKEKIKMMSYTEVMESVGLSQSTLHRMRVRGEFPPPRQLSRGRIAWLETQIEEWKAARPEAAL